MIKHDSLLIIISWDGYHALHNVDKLISCRKLWKNIGYRVLDIPHKWIVLFAHADWLAWRRLAKYYSPPLRWIIVKPWPNGDASWRKLKTCVNLRLRLARACVHLGWLWSRPNLHASRRKFFTVWPPNPSQLKLSNVHQPIISQLRLQTWQNNAWCKTLINDLTFRMPQHTSSEVTVG